MLNEQTEDTGASLPKAIIGLAYFLPAYIGIVEIPWCYSYVGGLWYTVYIVEFNRLWPSCFFYYDEV